MGSMCGMQWMMRHANTILVQKPKGGALGELCLNERMQLQWILKKQRVIVNWIYLAHDMLQQRAILKMIINHWIS